MLSILQIVRFFSADNRKFLIKRQKFVNKTDRSTVEILWRKSEFPDGWYGGLINQVKNCQCIPQSSPTILFIFKIFMWLFYFLPLIHLFLQLPVEFVYPLLQPLPPLLRGQVAVVLQRRRLVVRAGNAHSRLLSHVPPGSSPEVNATGCSDSTASAELFFLRLSGKQERRRLDQHVAAALKDQLVMNEWV